MTPVDMRRVEPLSTLSGDTPSETRQLHELAEKAREYLASFKWCAGILESYHGVVIPGVLGVFLFKIMPARQEVDEVLWVVVGDLPPAYLVTDDASTPEEALREYVREMRAWAAAALSGESVEDLIPVNVPPTKEYATMLTSRLDFLERRIVSGADG